MPMAMASCYCPGIYHVSVVGLALLPLSYPLCLARSSPIAAIQNQEQTVIAMANSVWTKPKAVVAIIIGACVINNIASFLSSTVERQPTTDSLRRQLAMYEWARENIHPLTFVPRPSNTASKQPVLFWHIPKSGGSTAKAYYRCMGKTVGVVSQPDSILRAKEKGLVASGKIDIIFASFPEYTIEQLFDFSHKTRVLAMFRHPVDRLVSKFYYLQMATWEKTYKEEWRDISVLEWAQYINGDNNHMVKKLAGKLQNITATEIDLNFAKKTIKNRFVVGLVDDMAESMRRFDVIMGINDETKFYESCNREYFGGGKKKTNSNAHPYIGAERYTYQLLAEKNDLDVQLYNYVLELYEEQKEVIDFFANTSSAAIAPV